METKDKEKIDFLEQAIIQAIIANNQNVDKIATTLNPADFVNELRKSIYAGMVALAERGDNINATTVTNEIAHLHPHTDVFTMMCEITKNSMDCNVTHYANLLLRTKRRLDYKNALAAQLKAAQSDEAEVSLEKLLTDTSAAIEMIYNNLKTSNTYSLNEIWTQFLEQKEQEFEGNIPFQAYTGFPDVDFITEGFREGNLITIAAESGGGKTTFGLNVLKNIAIQQQVPVLLLSLEMNKHEIGISTLASISKASQTQLKEVPKNKKDLDTVCQAYTKAIKNNGINDFAVHTENIETIVGAINVMKQHLKTKPECKVIMIDYIGLMNTGDKYNENRVQQISYMTRALKNFAMSHNVIILMLAQLNRNNKEEKRNYRLSDLRESGSIAFDSNCVIFIEHPPEIKPNVNVNIAKNRNGKTGFATLYFNGATASFGSIKTDIYNTVTSMHTNNDE